MGVNDFDRVASFYDRLAGLVFGGEILKSQISFLDQVTASDRILILGGGTGQLLKYLPQCEQVDFVEKSQKMVSLAKRRKVNQSINFINEDFFEYESDITFDIIICPFFLDCFDEEYLSRAIHKIKDYLKTEGRLIVSDFDNQSTNRWLSRAMHGFFRLAASLNARKLLEIRNVVSQAGLKEKEIISFRKGIFSAIYELEQ